MLLGVAKTAQIEEIARHGALWDQWWVQHSARRPHLDLLHARDIGKSPDAGLSSDPLETFDRSLSRHHWTHATRPCGLYVSGALLREARVVELGCGTGQEGVFLSPWVKRYLGIESSKHCTIIASAHAGSNMRIAHATDLRLFKDLSETFDVFLARHVFQHLNGAHAAWSLHLAATLLRRGGIAVADFSSATVAEVPASVRPASNAIDVSEPMLHYEFSDIDIYNLATDLCFEVVDLKTVPSLTTKFATLKRL
jgi:SAM-dependent methyltransferase